MGAGEADRSESWAWLGSDGGGEDDQSGVHPSENLKRPVEEPESDMGAATAALEMLGRQQKASRVRLSSMVALADLQGRPTVLIGATANRLRGRGDDGVWGRLLTDRGQLNPRLERLPAGWETRNQQLVFRVRVAGNAPAQPERVGWHPHLGCGGKIQSGQSSFV